MADKTTDLTGWTLGEKKLIKEEHNKVFAEESKKLAELKLGVEIDFPSLAANSKTDGQDNDVKKYPVIVYSRQLVDYTKELQKFAKNKMLLEELQHVCNKVLFQVVPSDSKGVRATYQFKSKVLVISLNPYFWCYSTDTEVLTKWLMAMRSMDGSNWTLKEKIDLQEEETKVWAEEKKRLAEKTGLSIEIDFKTLQSVTTEGSDARQYIPLIYSKFTKDYVGELIKFCSNPDYKEALGGAANKVLLTAAKPDEKGERAKFEIKSKVLVITLNPHFWCYSTDPENLSKHLEKSL